MRYLMLLAAVVATSAGCSTNNRMLDPVHTSSVRSAASHRGAPSGDSQDSEDPYENPTSRRVDALWP
jgi:hypothetical protein